MCPFDKPDHVTDANSDGNASNMRSSIPKSREDFGSKEAATLPDLPLSVWAQVNLLADVLEMNGASFDEPTSVADWADLIPKVLSDDEAQVFVALTPDKIAGSRMVILSCYVIPYQVIGDLLDAHDGIAPHDMVAQAVGDPRTTWIAGPSWSRPHGEGESFPSIAITIPTPANDPHRVARQPASINL
jgi:hypothetical protein